MRKFYLTIDQEIIDLYHECYFETYSRRRVEPIKSIFPPTLNKFIALKRMAQNTIKGKYKEFASWVASYYQIANLKMEFLEISYKFYFGDRRRRDMDNTMITPKFFNDGFVDAGVMIDDDGKLLQLTIEPFGYDKEHPRIEIVITEKKGNGKKKN